MTRRKESLTDAIEKTKTPAVLIAHPTGNQNLRNATQALAENGMLAEFWTTVAWDSSSPWNRLLPGSVRAQLARRAYPDLPKDRIHCVPWREMVRLGARPERVRAFLSSGERPFSIIGMYRHFDRTVSRRVASLRPDAVYAYEGGALATFREAKRMGIPTLYELPSSHWYWEHRLLSEEAERNPEFAGLLPKLKDSPGHMEWKDEELSLADVVMVPSRHVHNTLAGVVPEDKIRVVSYGAPSQKPRRLPIARGNRPLRVLYVGALIQRKGISYLLDAIDVLGAQVELKLVGKRFRENRRVDEACRRWPWFESLPHGAVMNLMTESDVLVLPSLTEGCALVVLEALSCGLPVIVTPNTGSLEFVRDGREGFVVPVCDSDAIAARLQILIDDRDLVMEMSRQAQKTAGEHSWANYRRNWADAVREVA